MKILIPSTREPAYTGGTVVYLDPDDQSAYWQFWSDVWEQQDPVIVVEHDIVPSGQALAELIECSSEWCTQPYPYFVGMYHGLGCVKFTTSIMQAVPDLWVRVASMSNGNHPPRHWCTLDSWSHNVLANSGHQPCQHETAVVHLNVGKPSHNCI